MSENLAAQKSCGAELVAAPSVLETLVDSVTCGVLLFGPSGKLSFANDRLAEMLRMERTRIDGFATFESLVSHLAPRFADSEAVAVRWRQRFERDEASWDALELQRPERRFLERFARPILDVRGQRQGWMEIYRDVTTQRLIESKLLHTERMAAIGQMVSGIAHELNNPLTSILGYARLLLTRRRKNISRRGADLRRILQQAERVSRIAQNLLLLSRETKPERLPVDLNEVVERSLALRSYELRLENIEVVKELARRLPPTLADSIQLQQVLLNLIVNAEQAIQQDKGKGHIWLRTRRSSPDRVALEVIDDGPGIAPEPLAHVFDPFFTTKPPGVGTGLGLSIVYGIVHDHGGEVLVESREGAGATFTVELPIAKATASAALARPRRPRPMPPPVQRQAQTPVLVQTPSRKTPLRRESILVVEDEPTVVRLIADVLSEEGHTVDTVLDSRKALDLVRRKNYDLVICDLRMPHIDGRAFYHELVRRGSPLGQRLVFVTGDTVTPHNFKFLESSGVPYLAKPFLVDELKQVVHRALAAAPRPRTSRLALPGTGGKRRAQSNQSGHPSRSSQSSQRNSS
jgi:two-component system, NtrC family, sensor kinase